MSKRGAKGEGGHILHLVICSLREELLEDEDEVYFVRILELEHYLSWREACIIYHRLFTGEVLLLRRVHFHIGAHQLLREF
jgi:hypothetical protein